MKKIKSLFELFLAMLKIGAFTFGGGYAMISLFDHEFVEKRGWLEREEFLDLVTIAESTPGPIAINCATYIGYKREKILGSIASTIGMVLPSLVVIYIISLFLDSFLASPVIKAAFEGIQVCVVFLILSAGVKMLKKMKKTPFNIAIFSATLVCMSALTLLSVRFSSIFYILISGAIGTLIYTVGYFKSKKNSEVEK
jgi:chromate transporter